MSEKLLIAIIEGFAIGVGIILAQKALSKIAPDQADQAAA